MQARFTFISQGYLEIFTYCVHIVQTCSHQASSTCTKSGGEESVSATLFAGISESDFPGSESLKY